MSRSSDIDADTLRSWLRFTTIIHADKPGSVAVPHAPVGMMVLVYLSIQPSGSATLAQLRDAFAMDSLDTTSISHAARPLVESGLLTKVRHRETELRLTNRGRVVVGQYFHAAFPPNRS